MDGEDRRSMMDRRQGLSDRRFRTKAKQSLGSHSKTDRRTGKDDDRQNRRAGVC